MGATWSMPEMRPLAIDGAAPEHHHEEDRRLRDPNSRIANGNHTIDGMVCSPVISEPTAVRRTL